MWKGILWPAIAVCCLWLIAGAATSYYISWQSKELDRVLEENVSSIVASNKMQEIVWKMQSVVMQSALERSPRHAGELLNLESQFKQTLNVADTAATMQEERLLVQQIHKRFDYYASRWRHAMTDSTTTSAELLELLPLVPQITRPCEDVVKFNEEQVHASSVHRQTLTGWIVWGRAFTLIIGPSFGLFLGYRLATHLRRSITNISVRLQSVTDDLEQEVGLLEISPDVDFPSIQRQLDVVADRMRTTIGELHQAREEALRSDRLAAVGELAAGVAHEIRNPLTSVKLLIQTTQHRNQALMPNETFAVILAEINRMETTIQGLLDFARPPKPKRARYDLRDVVKRAVNLSEGMARHNQVALSVVCDTEPVWVNSDAEQLHQVCVNLLMNGIESMPQGGEFVISVEADPSHKTANVRFEDCGTGIPQNMLPRLFEPFVTSKDHGTGLGLAVSRRIISNHNGLLTAENREQGGARLAIQLPLEEVAVERIDVDAHPIAC